MARVVCSAAAEGTSKTSCQIIYWASLTPVNLYPYPHPPPLETSAHSEWPCWTVDAIIYKRHTFLHGYCSTVQGLLDWFEVDLMFTELLLDCRRHCMHTYIWHECHLHAGDIRPFLRLLTALNGLDGLRASLFLANGLENFTHLSRPANIYSEMSGVTLDYEGRWDMREKTRDENAGQMCVRVRVWVCVSMYMYVYEWEHVNIYICVQINIHIFICIWMLHIISIYMIYL